MRALQPPLRRLSERIVTLKPSRRRARYAAIIYAVLGLMYFGMSIFPNSKHGYVYIVIGIAFVIGSVYFIMGRGFQTPEPTE